MTDLEKLLNAAHTITIKPKHGIDKDGATREMSIDAKVTTSHKYSDKTQFDFHEIRVTAPTFEDAVRRCTERLPK